MDKPDVQPFSLGAKEREIVYVRGLCRAADYSAWPWEGQDICGIWRNPLGIVLPFFPVRSIG